MRTPLEPALCVTTESRKRVPHLHLPQVTHAFPRDHTPQPPEPKPRPPPSTLDMNNSQEDLTGHLSLVEMFPQAEEVSCARSIPGIVTVVFQTGHEKSRVSKPRPWERILFLFSPDLFRGKHLDHDCCKVLKKITFLYDFCQLLPQLEQTGQNLLPDWIFTQPKTSSPTP